jgi:hypothetical protein
LKLLPTAAFPLDRTADSFPEALQAGCYWRLDWFMGADNPSVSSTQVACPAAITVNTGCVRSDDGSAPAVPSASGSAAVTSSASNVATSIVEGLATTSTAAQGEVFATMFAAWGEAITSLTPTAIASSSLASTDVLAQSSFTYITT